MIIWYERIEGVMVLFHIMREGRSAILLILVFELVFVNVVIIYCVKAYVNALKCIKKLILV